VHPGVPLRGVRGLEAPLPALVVSHRPLHPHLERAGAAAEPALHGRRHEVQAEQLVELVGRDPRSSRSPGSRTRGPRPPGAAAPSCARGIVFQMAGGPSTVGQGDLVGPRHPLSDRRGASGPVAVRRNVSASAPARGSPRKTGAAAEPGRLPRGAPRARRRGRAREGRGTFASCLDHPQGTTRTTRSANAAWSHSATTFPAVGNARYSAGRADAIGTTSSRGRPVKRTVLPMATSRRRRSRPGSKRPAPPTRPVEIARPLPRRACTGREACRRRRWRRLRGSTCRCLGPDHRLHRRRRQVVAVDDESSPGADPPRAAPRSRWGGAARTDGQPFPRWVERVAPRSRHRRSGRPKLPCARSPPGRRS